MPDDWATYGIDLHVELAGQGLRSGLERALRGAVRSGRLRPGLLLPSSRTLARDLGIARNTAADAYGQLVAEGWLVARQGSGTRVADREPGGPPSAEAAQPGPDAAISPSGAQHQPPSGAQRQPRYDLRAGTPDLSSFPRAAWLAAARRALDSADNHALGYTDPRGRQELRIALADYLARARGVRVSAERVVICSGFTQALGLLCQVLRARGATTLATEAYGLRSNHAIIAAHGLRLQVQPVDAQGADVEHLADADAVLLTPAHQFPLGPALAAGRRDRAVRWAVESGRLIIEDDYDGEFRYDRQPLGALQALAPEHVVYAGTASKTLAPGLRLGWLVLPGELIDELVDVKTLADRNCGVLDQLTLAQFIVSGGYDRHVRRCRLAYRRRRDRLVTELRARTPHVRIAGVAAGLHAVVELPHGLREHDVVRRAARHGLAVEGLDEYRAGPPSGRGPALVVGYGRPAEHAFTGAIARLSAVLSESLAAPVLDRL